MAHTPNYPTTAPLVGYVTGLQSTPDSNPGVFIGATVAVSDELDLNDPSCQAAAYRMAAGLMEARAIALDAAALLPVPVLEG